ncbi:MAG: hypothetical protein UW30_C0017G0018 [Candidatus Giovannonibacteria bacterium GW2011_GWA2_44_13b]|uniref:Uncharacterized protein n=1 Tax=Candidatus Giovannonibacteria bacterium GW2011_GWA2_44_13b TaxID=1618647 RepID=A0A0G1H2W0_9BACT|nr:MAG: hypothetical protein UW30_C0017G0018 [Candidatus Giovannonibacteria bacterium GW2011_GWA2_44_13b]
MVNIALDRPNGGRRVFRPDKDDLDPAQHEGAFFLDGADCFLVMAFLRTLWLLQ